MSPLASFFPVESMMPVAVLSIQMFSYSLLTVLKPYRPWPLKSRSTILPSAPGIENLPVYSCEMNLAPMMGSNLALPVETCGWPLGSIQKLDCVFQSPTMFLAISTCSGAIWLALDQSSIVGVVGLSPFGCSFTAGLMGPLGFSFWAKAVLHKASPAITSMLRRLWDIGSSFGPSARATHTPRAHAQGEVYRVPRLRSMKCSLNVWFRARSRLEPLDDLKPKCF